MLKWIGASVAVVLVGLVVGTYLALESGEVLIVETRDHESGERRRTHIWFVQVGEQLFLEAGHPDNPWVQDIGRDAEVNFVGDGLSGAYRLDFVRDAGSHEEIRELMRAKYGWRDRWVATIFDTSQSQWVEARAQAGAQAGAQAR